VHKKPSGEPFLVFTGGAEKLALERKIEQAVITLSHTDNYAVAMVVMEG
jgi:phosphopantetheinyl transferase (holo-ACP synthase)